MTKPNTTALPALLQRFQQYLPGDIFAVAAKVHLEAGISECAGNQLSDASWNNDKTALVVTFNTGAQTTLMLEGSRLLTKCDCHQWQPARNCPHVVIAWATLKRTVSPETLSHIRFNQQMLLDMKRYLEQEPLAGDQGGEATQKKPTTLKDRLEEARRMRRRNLAEKTKSPAVPESRGTFRLLLESNGYGHRIRGSIKQGAHTVHGWTTRGLPTDLARFLATAYYYESTLRYFKTFTAMTNGNYPIVFLDASGKETTLELRGDLPLRAGISLDIQGEEVLIARTLENGKPFSPRAITHGQLLFDLNAGTIHPVVDQEVWVLWEQLVDELHSMNDQDGFDPFDDSTIFDDDDDDFDEDEEFFEPGESDDQQRIIGHLPRLSGRDLLRLLPNSIAAPIAVFNAASIRLQPELLGELSPSCAFFHNGQPVSVSRLATTSYILDIPEGIGKEMVSMVPVGIQDDQIFPFSSSAFRIFNPSFRSLLSAPLKAKKRLRSILETAFTLLGETRVSARNSIIRSLTSSPDFSRRDVKSETRQLLNLLADEWNRKMMLIRAMPDGWHCSEDDHRNQAALLRILFELFGHEVFVDSFMPGEVELGRDRLLKELPDLAGRLQSGGFSLRIGSVPLSRASWEFSLDATNSGLDWFELKPEIRCDGEILSPEELRGLLDGTGMLCREGRILLLDEAGSRVLAMFAGAMPSSGKKRTAAAEPLRVPRLQILDWLQLRSHGVSVKLAPEDARVLESLLNFDSIPVRPLPAGLVASLRHYQAEAWHWLAFLYEHRFGACLADDMGLGKTLQGITLLAGIMSGEIASSAPDGTVHLVVAPPSLLFNWEAEINRFLPTARVCLYTGTGRSTETFGEHDIVITSYGIVQRDIAELEKLPYNVIIFDETQVVKNLQAATTSAARRLRGSFVLALTGTPVENHLGEYFAIMDLCLPGLLGSRDEFSRQSRQSGAEGAGRLIGRTRPFVLRRTKQMISSELPPKIETDIQLELAPKQKLLYQRIVEEVRGQVREAYSGHAPAQARIIALTAILRLRQICLAPALAVPGASESSPKLEFLAEQLTELADEGHSALVFSQFNVYLNIIEQGLKRLGLNYLRLDGSTPVPVRKKLVQAFQNSSEPAVFLISLKAGGRGLNLTRATYVYHMDPWWNPAVENQASDRAHRIGQTGQVTITRLIMRHTIEEKMMLLKEKKLELYKAILEEGAGGGGAGLTREDFEFLLG
jgi:non-specific serine/threonine protein kinase